MSVSRQAAAGVAWNLAAGLSTRALGLVGSLILTRFVEPAEFGDVSAAVVVVATATRFADYSLGSYVMTRQTAPSVTFQAFGYHLGAIATACLAVTLFRQAIAAAVGDPDIARYVPWLALAAVLTHVARIPEATLYRALRFRTLATARAIGDVVYTVVSVSLVPFLRAGAVVAGNLARAVAFTATIVARSDRSEWFRPAALRLATAKEMLRFGVPLSARNLAETLASTWDILLVGRLFGSQVMGEYALASSLADIAGQVAEYIGEVLLPSLANLDVDRQRLALPRVSAMMALVLFPVIAGLAVVAPTLTGAMLPPHWADLAPMLAILCFRSVPIPVNSVFWSYFAVRRRTTPIMYIGMAKLALVVGLLLTLGRSGPLWACVAVVLAFQLTALLQVFVGWRLEHLPPGPLIATTLRPLVASGLMAVVVLLFRATIEAWMNTPIQMALVLELGVGLAAYAGTAFLVARPTTIEFIRVVRGVVSRKRSQGEELGG